MFDAGIAVLAAAVMAPLAMEAAPGVSIVFWSAVIVLALAQAALLVAELRRRRMSPPGEWSHMTGRPIEIVWLFLPVVLLALLLVFTWPMLAQE